MVNFKNYIMVVLTAFLVLGMPLLAHAILVVNTAPVLTAIPDQSALVGDVITFDVSATDDGLPVPSTLTITANTLGANFTDFGNGTGEFSWTAIDGGSTNITFTVTDGELSDTQTVAITVNTEVADCAFLNNGELDDTGVICPIDNSRALVCNLQLDEAFFGLNLNDHCCICNQNPGSGIATPLIECDPSLPAGSAPVNGVEPCFVNSQQKQPLEVTTRLEFNNDPYYCRTLGGRRTCWRY